MQYKLSQILSLSRWQAAYKTDKLHNITNLNQILSSNVQGKVTFSMFCWCFISETVFCCDALANLLILFPYDFGIYLSRIHSLIIFANVKHNSCFVKKIICQTFFCNWYAYVIHTIFLATIHIMTIEHTWLQFCL